MTGPISEADETFIGVSSIGKYVLDLASVTPYLASLETDAIAGGANAPA